MNNNKKLLFASDFNQILWEHYPRFSTKRGPNYENIHQHLFFKQSKGKWLFMTIKILRHHQIAITHLHNVLPVKLKQAQHYHQEHPRHMDLEINDLVRLFARFQLFMIKINTSIKRFFKWSNCLCLSTGGQRKHSPHRNMLVMSLWSGLCDISSSKSSCIY